MHAYILKFKFNKKIKPTGTMFSQTGFYTPPNGCPFILLVCFELKSISPTDLWPVVEDTKPNPVNSFGRAQSP